MRNTPPVQNLHWRRERLLLNFGAARLLIAVGLMRRASITAIAREVETTTAYASRAIKRMKALGLVEVRKKGRSKRAALTQDGRGVARALMAISPWRPEP